MQCNCLIIYIVMVILTLLFVSAVEKFPLILHNSTLFLVYFFSLETLTTV